MVIRGKNRASSDQFFGPGYFFARIFMKKGERINVPQNETSDLGHPANSDAHIRKRHGFRKDNSGQQ
jgi:hypothetical protein